MNKKTPYTAHGRIYAADIMFLADAIRKSDLPNKCDVCDVLTPVLKKFNNRFDDVRFMKEVLK